MYQILLGLCLAVFLNLSSFAASELYPFVNTQQQQRFSHLTQELRCLVCQNQSLADSNAPLAIDLRRDLAQQVLAGAGDQQVIDYMTQRYGDFILYRPRLQANTYLLWFAPWLMLGFGLWVLLGRRVRSENSK